MRRARSRTGPTSRTAPTAPRVRSGTPIQQSINAFLRNSGSGPGVFRVAPAKAGGLSGRRDWTTPALADGGTSGGTTTGGTPGAGCAATHRTVNSRPGGHQGEVTVRNNGTGTISGWSVGMTPGSGRTVTGLRNGVHTGTSGSATVRNNQWNGTLGAGAGVTSGYTANGGSTAPTGLTCTAP
ncbi:cellulose binding domain-containing protein [Streptomyces chilikensis]|uniref:Cellulose binding domain-containing protein n=1 Tax=Streptomyces chilikensis TaxID=1194079 RepID=A0ABV3EQ68_9ACTN